MMDKGAFRGANAFFGGVFVIMAGLQLNDPDPVRWIVLYVAAAAACFLARRNWLAPAIVGAAGLVWFVVLLPGTLPEFRLSNLLESMQAETPVIEASRELLGLAIVAGWMVVLTVAARRAATAG